MRATSPIDTIDKLQSAQTPVSFYDVVLLLRPLRRAMPVPDPILSGLLHLHSAPHLTIGAKEMLETFLKPALARIERERAASDNPVGIDRDGQTIRIATGGDILIQLPQPLTRGFTWEMTFVDDGLTVRRLTTSADEERADLTAHVAKAGPQRLAMHETGHPRIPRLTPRTFEIVLFGE